MELPNQAWHRLGIKSATTNSASLDDANHKQLKQMKLHQLTWHVNIFNPLQPLQLSPPFFCLSSHVLNDGAAHRDVGFHSLIIRLPVCLGDSCDLRRIFEQNTDWSYTIPQMTYKKDTPKDVQHSPTQAWFLMVSGENVQYMPHRIQTFNRFLASST